MATSAPNPSVRVNAVQLTAERLSVDLQDGRTIVVHLSWYPRLLRAPPAQVANCQFAGDGFGIRWPKIEKELSTQGLRDGARARQPSQLTRSIKPWRQ